MLTLIESFEPEATMVLGGRTLPACCLLEDADGIRWYVQPGLDRVDPHTWTRAATAGAAALLVVRPEGFAAMTAEAFAAARTESLTQGFLVPLTAWQAHPAMPSYLALLEGPQRDDDAASVGFVNLHTHFEYSLLDGITKASEAVEQAVAHGQRYLGSADHGNCAVHPDLQRECDRAGIKPVFGMEAYLVDDRMRRLEHFTLPEPPASDKEGKATWRAARDQYLAELRDYWHLVLYATDEQGLHNLWAMSTEAFHDGLYNRNPRLDWQTLERYSQGVIATTACLRGPLAHHGLVDGDEQAALARLARLMEIFGDRLYVEIHTNQLAEQVALNRELVRVARTYALPMVAAVDAHYPVPGDKEAHRVWLSVQTNTDINEDSSLFAGNQDYHLKSEAEVRAALAYLGQEVVDECVLNTARIALSATAMVRGTPVPPVFSKGGQTEDVDRLLDLCLGNWDAKVKGKPKPESLYLERLEHEFPLLVKKGYCGYYLMTAEMTNHARLMKWMVGPGRGSGGGSLAAYLAGITGIDPVDADILFERFLTEGRVALPDFDVDYAASRKRDVQQHARDVYGEDAVTVVGSVIRLKNKGIIDKLGKALASQLPEQFYLDQKKITTLIDEAEADTAGLGLSWEALWDRAGEQLAPFRDDYPYLFTMADRLVGRVHTFGQHAAGLVITTEGALTTRLPLRRATEDGHMIAQFDKDVLEDLGFIKFDLLTLRNLDTIQDTIDLIRQRRGHEVDVHSWRDEYSDPQVWEEIANAFTLGIFQIETALGTQYAKKMHPKNLSDLADLVTIVRPGPRNSGLTGTYIRRRNAQEPVTYPDPRLEPVLAKTYGCMLYQEDIMSTCMVLGGYDSTEADEVRKILGHKQVERVAAAGQEFVERVVARGMAREPAVALWAQMAEFAKYSFNRAHAYAYAMLGYWCAWLKFHYPVEFLTSALSGVDKDRIPDFIKEARRMGFKVLPPDINESGSGFRAGPLSVRYGLDSVKGVGEAAKHIQAAQPFTSFEDFMERVVEPKGSKVNRGHVAILAKIGAFDSLVPNRRGLEQMLLDEKSGEAHRCAHKSDEQQFVWRSINVRTKEEEEHTLPCSFDWESEPAPTNPRTGKKTKRKAPVKKCTRGCRNYLAPEPVAIASVQAYTDIDIRQIEADLLGVYLSSTPFDVLPAPEREATRTEAEWLSGERAPERLYVLAGILTKRKTHITRTGETMGFIELETEVNSLDVTVFPKAWARYAKTLTVGGFYIAEVERNSRGLNLDNLMLYTPQETAHAH